MSSRRWFLALLPITLMAACHRTPAPASAISGTAAGSREYPQGVFVYDVVAVGQHLRGRVTIVDTLVTLEPVDDSCVRSGALHPDWRANPVVGFSCLGVPAAGGSPGQRTTFLEIHLQYPVTHSRWSRVDRVEVVDSRHVQDRRCIRWTADRFGRQSCTRYEDPPLHRAVPVPVSQSGSLPLMPAYVVLPDTSQRSPDERS